MKQNARSLKDGNDVKMSALLLFQDVVLNFKIILNFRTSFCGKIELIMLRNDGLCLIVNGMGGVADCVANNEATNRLIIVNNFFFKKSLRQHKLWSA